MISISLPKFQDIQLTSFAGLAVIQHFIQQSGLWEKVARCCKHVISTRHYQPATIIQCLIMHLLLGYRKLRDMDFYRDDPMVKGEIPGIRIEVRMDSAFYSEAMIEELERLGVEYTISVPFERFGLFKKWINERFWWHSLPGGQSKDGWFEKHFRPKSWKRKARFLFVRQETALQQKGPLQLDLFEPRQRDYSFKAIITNKRISAKKVVRFHEGRGYQETLYSELKSKVQMEYIPCRKWVANRIYLLANFLTHNAMREMQMSACPAPRKATEKRTVRWVFEGIDTLRKKIIQRAGKISFPQGRFTLTLSPNPAVEAMMERFL